MNKRLFRVGRREFGATLRQHYRTGILPREGKGIIGADHKVQSGTGRKASDQLRRLLQIKRGSIRTILSQGSIECPSMDRQIGADVVL